MNERMIAKDRDPADRRRVRRLILIAVAGLFLVGGVLSWVQSLGVDLHPLDNLRMAWDQNRRAFDQYRRKWDDKRRAWEQQHRAQEQARPPAKQPPPNPLANPEKDPASSKP